MNQKALKFYYKSMRKRFFYLFVDGINKTCRERELNDLALDHYGFNFIKKVFEVWR
jgi:hypothetical protein